MQGNRPLRRNGVWGKGEAKRHTPSILVPVCFCSSVAMAEPTIKAQWQKTFDESCARIKQMVEK